MILGIFISLCGIYLGFRKFDYRSFFSSLSEVNYLYLLLAVFIQIVNVFFRAIRWKIILNEVKEIKLKKVFAATMVCYFGNNVFPFRFGEVLRSLVLGNSEKVSSVSIFGTVIMERILDTLVFVIVLGISLLVVKDLPSWVNEAGVLVLLSVVIFLVLSYIYLFMNKRNYNRLILMLDRKETGIRKKIKSLLVGLNSLAGVKDKAGLVFYSFLVWFISIVMIYVVGLSYNLHMGLEEIILLFFTTSLVISIPSAPGYIGTFHAGVISLMLYLGYGRDVAQGFSIILHGVGFVTLTLFGLFYFLKMNVKIPLKSS